MKIAKMEVTPRHPIRWGDDLDVVNAARVSFDKEHEMFLEPTDSRLIRYLARHKHFSPFNHSFLSFRVKAPIFVARQLVKHKFMPWNEVSRRYVDEEPEFYDPGYNGWRLRAADKKQGSLEETTTTPSVVLSYQQDSWYEDEEFDYQDVCACSIKMYDAMLEKGIAPEQARMVLPQSMMTEWIWSGTLGAFLDMLTLRLDPHTQEESRYIATLIAAEVKKYFPISYEARIGV